MTSFIFDTSSQFYPFCLSTSAKVIHSKQLSFEKKQSSELLPAIERFFEENTTSLKELSFIAVGLGPGAFTGTRVGVMIAKSWGFALNIPLIGFSSLEWLAPTQPLDNYLIVSDGKSQGLYVLEIINGISSQPYSLNKSKLVDKVQKENFKIVCDLAIQQNFPELLSYFAPNSYPNFERVSKICWNLYSQGKILSPSELSPFYCRSSD